MSQKQRSRLTARGRAQARVFAALGDETRLALIAKLSGGQPCSISQLTQGSKLTRQAITKHLRVLESAQIVHSVHAGRESLFEFDPTPIKEMREYLDFVSEQWDHALARLKSYIEEGTECRSPSSLAATKSSWAVGENQSGHRSRQAKGVARWRARESL